jgi:c-di-GMP-binding flagellar brake protein YcgR
MDLLVMAAGDQTSAVMTHISRGKWHMTKVLITGTEGQFVHLEIPQKEKHHPINIRIDQPVGISFKHDFSKYIFQSVVTGFEQSFNLDSGGIVVISAPDYIERIQRRHFYRVAVPERLTVDALFWHRGYNDDSRRVPDENYWRGRLVDVSAGGLLVRLDITARPAFRQGQLVGLQFTPMPYERPILLECQVRHIAPTPDGKHLCLGMQIVGLEATPDGHEVLHRLCEVVKTYFNMNQKANLLHTAAGAGFEHNRELV